MCERCSQCGAKTPSPRIRVLKALMRNHTQRMMQFVTNALLEADMLNREPFYVADYELADALESYLDKTTIQKG